jgi:malonate transporter and related proteins
MINLILQGIVPVVFVLALGYYAGRKGFISEDGAQNFSTYIVNFALPCTLFVGIFSFTPKQFDNGGFILTLCLSLILPFIFGIGIARLIFKRPLAEAGLFACNCGFPDMAYFGLPVLISIVGSQALLPVIVGNLVTSVFMVPVIVYMVHRGTAAPGGKGAGSFLGNMVSTLGQPVVWAPILGLVLVLLNVKLPALLGDSLKLFGQTTGGVALFTLGALLSRLKMKIDWPAAAVVFMKNLVMPAIALGLSLLFHLDGPLAKGAIIVAACPAATFGAMLSAKARVGQTTIPPQILVSNIVGIFSMGFWIFVAGQLV